MLNFQWWFVFRARVFQVLYFDLKLQMDRSQLFARRVLGPNIVHALNNTLYKSPQPRIITDGGDARKRRNNYCVDGEDDLLPTIHNAFDSDNDSVEKKEDDDDIPAIFEFANENTNNVHVLHVDGEVQSAKRSVRKRRATAKYALDVLSTSAARRKKKKSAAAKDDVITTDEILSSLAGDDSQSSAALVDAFPDDLFSSEEPRTADAEVPQKRACRYPSCGKLFTNQKLLEMHIKSHRSSSSEAEFLCQVCGKPFARKPYLTKHAFTHETALEHGCKICGKHFVSPNNLWTHKQIHSNESYECEQCGKIFSTKQNLAQHQLRHARAADAPSSRFPCDVCGKLLSSKKSLRHHGYLHSEEPSPFACSVCSETFASRRRLRTHESTHLEAKPFGCEECGKHYSSKQSLQDHLGTHSREPTLACDICGRPFFNNKRMQIHRRTHSSGERRFECELCGRCFKSGNLLKAHQKTKHAVAGAEKPFACDICGKKLSDKYYVQKHQLSRQCHAGALRRNRKLLEEEAEAIAGFGCKTCGRQCGSKLELREHRSAHRSERPGFVCSVCGKQLSTKQSMQLHKLTRHTVVEQRMLLEDEDTACKTCGVWCGSMLELRDHRRAHRRERPARFVCDLCGKQLSTKHSMQLHRQLHFSDNTRKQHACPFCACLFSQFVRLKKHLLVHAEVGDVPASQITATLARMFRLRQAVVMVDDAEMGSVDDTGDDEGTRIETPQLNDAEFVEGDNE